MRKKLFSSNIYPSEITSRTLFDSRRRWLQGSVASLSALAMPEKIVHSREDSKFPAPIDANKSKFSSDEEQTSYADVTRYNNFYEFGTGKEDPFEQAYRLKTEGWRIQVIGDVMRPKTFDMDDILRLAPVEERIYRLRCVEAWSMVIPWVGFPLAKLLNAVQPTGNARFVEFISLYDIEQMPGQKSPVLRWPYTEGLRIDEAMNPLTLLTLGLYGEILPNQNGAPVRIVVPWKYGFKSAKSIVTIRLTEKQPASSWNLANPNEYGFYSNVNPNVSHPRWSQRRERRIGEFLKRDTLMFNGYSEWVADLYRDLDLNKYF
ncbi:MAG: protein-methionine-sulfoxide reductase catalytic subunit MsrP [Burkholderiales bacterium]|nr:MAG: mononuclear molybdenum enzyme YedY [Betaproteobacteria bacterium TMED22]